MKPTSFSFEQTKLTGLMRVFWILTILSAYCGSAVLSFTVPNLGEIFPFRVLLPVTFCLFLVVILFQKINIWKNSGVLEKLSYLLIVILLAYGALSLRWAIDFAFSFRRLFNLCFDLGFFFLSIQLCRDAHFMKATVITIGCSLALMCILGVYEVAFGGIFNNAYDDLQDVSLLYGFFQYPVVTFINTNDYISTLVFSLVIVLLYWGYHYISNQKNVWVPLVTVPICFFLAYMASSRLGLICMWIILAGLTAFFFLQAKNRRWIPILLLVVYLLVAFISDFRYIKMATEKYADDMEDYIEYRMDIVNAGENDLEEVSFPKFKIVRPAVGLRQELFDADESGNIILNDSASGGVRLRLLKHTLDCFIDSFGLGVGLGNTEQLARLNKVIKGGRIWSIHCFIARIISDLGIFVLIPLLLIVLKLLKMLAKTLRFHIKTCNKPGVALLLFTFASAVIYPFMSTASSDAQDLLLMWLYLGILVIFIVQLHPSKTAE